MSQKKGTWKVTFHNGTSVTVIAKGKRMALNKACVETHLPGTAIESHDKLSARRRWGNRW